MTFGYDADVVRFWTIASSNRLDDHGKSLAYSILDQRANVGQRPIIFVAHSLGGLVCEEALNLSYKRQDLASILPNTLGIIFMGTPHGGSQLASWGSTVAKYVNIFRGTNRDILGNLQPGSADLQRTEEDFQQMLRQGSVNLKIYCFYEALKMNDMIGKIVERESAILPAYDNCSINANHRTMTKFTGRDDAGYGQIRGVLRRWIEESERSLLIVNEMKAGSSHGERPYLDDDSRQAYSYAAGSTHEGRPKNNSNGPETVSYPSSTLHDGQSNAESNAQLERPYTSGAVFNGPISGRTVIAGTQNTHGTMNFTFN